MFSKEDCFKWRQMVRLKKNDKKQCCSNPKIQHFSVQKRRGDEISTLYKLCINCNKKIVH